MTRKISSLHELSKFFPLNGKWKNRGFTANGNFEVVITKKKAVLFFENQIAVCTGVRSDQKRKGSWEEMLKLYFPL